MWYAGESTRSHCVCVKLKCLHFLLLLFSFPLCEIYALVKDDMSHNPFFTLFFTEMMAIFTKLMTQTNILGLWNQTLSWSSILVYVWENWMFCLPKWDSKGNVDYITSAKQNKTVLYEPWTVTGCFVSYSVRDAVWPVNYVKSVSLHCSWQQWWNRGILCQLRGCLNQSVIVSADAAVSHNDQDYWIFSALCLCLPKTGTLASRYIQPV